MDNAFFHRLSRFCWRVLLLALLALALYVTCGRYLMSQVSPWRDRILDELNQRLPFVVDAQTVSGHWQSFSPVLELKGLKISAGNGSATPIELAAGSVTLDVWNSLLTQSLQLSDISLEALQLQGELDEQGVLRFSGLSGDGNQFGEQLLDFLLNLKQVALHDNVLHISTPKGELKTLGLNLAFQTAGGERSLHGEVLIADSGTVVQVAGTGYGDPRASDHFQGQLYTRFRTTELDRVLALLPPALTHGLGSATGTATISSWLNWRNGEPQLTVQAEAEDILLRGAAHRPWQLALSQLSFNAVAKQRDGEFWLMLDKLNARDELGYWHLPALQVSVAGSAVALRASELQIAQLQHFLSASQLLTGKTAEVVASLQPRGAVNQLAMTISDYRKPAQSWSARARFSGLAVDPWRKGVGLSGVSGYVQGGHQGRAQILMDSRDFALRVPGVYHHPLVFDSVLAAVDMHWNGEGLKLKSGLIEASGEEGNSRAVLALDLPFSRTEEGPKMELMVGLESSHPRYRHKFVPYVLPTSLRGWLDHAIADDSNARVVDAGFLWRGSLRVGAYQHRTIQLFVDVDQLDVQFDPAWPPVQNFAGLLFVDDVRASVWGERGHISGLELPYISAEVWKNQQQNMLLDVAVKAAGTAEQTLQLVNNSPLSASIQGVAEQWQGQGSVAADVNLRISLKGLKQTPEVDVSARLNEVGLDLGEVGLSLNQLQGQVRYHSDQGFDSTGLQGRLWGEQVQLNLQQHPPLEQASSQGLDIQFSGPVAVERVRAWLKIPPLALASGKTPVAGRISIEENEAPLLYVASNLQGLTLDLPKPWGKDASQSGSLQIRLPLAGQQRTARLVLGEMLADIALKGKDVRGVSIGIGEEPTAIEPSQFLVNGHVSELNVAQWQATLAQYFQNDHSDDTLSLLAIDKLVIDRLILLGQRFDQVQISAYKNPQSWQVSASNGLARVRLSPEENTGQLVLHAPRLDLAVFDAVDSSALGQSFHAASLAAMQINIDQLSNGGRPLGRVAFSLQIGAEGVLADNIVGELGRLSLKADKPGRLQWRGGELGWSRFEGQLHFDNLGDVLAFNDYQRIIESQSGQLNVDLTWPGAPQAIGLKNARGSMNFSIGSGQFLEASATTAGALRVVSVLNLADFVSRLSLDLSSFVKSGIVFDNITGDVQLAQDQLTIAGVDVSGRSSRFFLSGTADVEKKFMDTKLAVTLPVTNNLPLVAAATGAWPLAAGLFVVGQVFGDQMDRMASVMYRVKGPWDNPDVSLRRLFDDNDRAAKEQPKKEP